MTSFVVTAVHFHRLGHLSFEMAGQVLPSAEGNIRQKMADLHLDLATQEVTYLTQITGDRVKKKMQQELNKWSHFLGPVTPHIRTCAPRPLSTEHVPTDRPPTASLIAPN